MGSNNIEEADNVFALKSLISKQRHGLTWLVALDGGEVKMEDTERQHLPQVPAEVLYDTSS
jgi:hypothetical protein